MLLVAALVLAVGVVWLVIAGAEVDQKVRHEQAIDGVADQIRALNEAE